MGEGSVVMTDALKTAIRERVVNGTDYGGFVDAVATRDWEKALARADARHREEFVEIMVWRLNSLPGGCAKPGVPVERWQAVS